MGDIIECYDTDKIIPVLGFGAAIEPFVQKANHCFALNGDIFNPGCFRIKGVKKEYKTLINNKKVKLSGPTHFAPVIELVNDLTESMNVSQKNQKYNILLILTDGLIDDM